MTLYIASKNMRGAWARPPVEGCHKVDVTSAQSKGSLYRKGFSPMHVEEGRKYAAPDGDDYACFEHWWQARKVYRDVNHKKANQWWRSQMKPKRRYPNSKGKRVLHALDPRKPGVQMGYVTSRKEIYIPDYLAKIKDTAGQKALLKVKVELEKGDVVIYDFDGPRNRDNEPLCREVTLELLKEKINDTTHPFGHGYVVAAEVLGVAPELYSV